MAGSVADEKKYLRAVLNEARASLPGERVRALSHDVQLRLLACPHFIGAPALALYSPKDNEVATELLFERALAAGKAVYFPRIDSARRAIALVRVRAREDLAPGAFGIDEPRGDEIADPARLGPALICVPGLAFSPRGGRLGRGGGYYDRMLAGAGAGVMAAGLAYSFQVLDTLAESPHDRRLDFIVTESGVLAPAAAPQAAGRRTDHQGGTPR
jgi:5-formyltetrahydrofolate cyclo-ligase